MATAQPPSISAALDEAVHQLCSTSDSIAPGHRTALIGAINTQGASFDIQAKLDERGRWVIDGQIEHSWNGDTGAGFALKGSF